MEKLIRRPLRSTFLEPWQDISNTPYVKIENISKTFDGSRILQNISLEIYKGEFFSILGPSGCGKSTFLRMLAGLEIPETGKIYIDGIDMTDMPPYERPVNIMFQSYALFPHMTVMQNIAFGLIQDKISKTLIKERVDDALKLVQMEKLANRYPHQLSGGQRQRVALARCLIKKPKVLLLDEPLAALDKKLREETQFELVNIQESLGITFIVVTHDQEEAMTMSTRLAIMEHGRIRQVGTPSEIYEFPNSEYVADFIGTTNIFYGVVTKMQKNIVIVEGEDLPHPFATNHSANVLPGTHVSMAIRPEKIMISKKPKKTKYNMAKGIVEEIAYLGDVSIYYIRLENSDHRIQAMLPNLKRRTASPIKWEDTVYLSWLPESIVLLTVE